MIVETIFAVIFIYYFIYKPANYWKERHVPTGRIIPLIGEHFLNILGEDCDADLVNRVYNKVHNTRYIGTYFFQRPVLVPKSPELIKEICVTNSNNVLNRQGFTNDCSEPLMAKNLFGLNGEIWRTARRILSPSFTSLKLKSMHNLLCKNAQRTVDFFIQKDKEFIEVEMREVFSRFTNDIIANAMFGLEVNSFTDQKNAFYMMGEDVTDYSDLWKIFVIVMYDLSPRLAKFLNLNLYSKNVTDFFMNLVEETIKHRECNNIQRSDILGTLLDKRKILKNSKSNEKNLEDKSPYIVTDDEFVEEFFSNEDITAHLFFYYLAGFDTSSTAMCFMAYELATNPEIQAKLIQEIDDNKIDIDGIPSYETIMNMPYLDMVVSETLRKWPNAAQTDRIVTSPFTIEPVLPGEKPVLMNKGDRIMIPIFGIHRDPQYYENPECFDPQRFSPENRKNINPYTYLPFGVGPKICIGMKLGLLKIKLIFVYLLSHFEIVANEKTEIPLILEKSVITMKAKNGFQLSFKRRNLYNK